ncbi:MAG: hypothetical protein L7F78_24060 [Syntrophales bacterium LBB04]|nr:hypothetical protein [Syntrophales bacterium LBB04]
MGLKTYTEILDKANAFMDNSGIREFCRSECGGKCCEMLKEFESDSRCGQRITCEKKLPCVLFLCSRAEDFLLDVIGIRDVRWSGFQAVLKEVTDGIACRLAELGVSMPDAYRSTYSLRDIEGMTFSVDYPDFTDTECRAIRRLASGDRRP